MSKSWVSRTSFHGIGLKDGARAYVVHNTIAACNVGVTVYASDDAQPAGRAYLFNNILWNNRGWHSMTPQDVVNTGAWWPRYSDVVQGEVDASDNIVSAPLAGRGNRVTDEARVAVERVIDAADEPQRPRV